MPLNEMPPDPVGQPKRALQIDRITRLQRSKIRDPEGFSGKIGLKEIFAFDGNRQAATVYRHAVADLRPGKRKGRLDPNPCSLLFFIDFQDLPGPFNDSAEHRGKIGGLIDNNKVVFQGGFRNFDRLGAGRGGIAEADLLFTGDTDLAVLISVNAG